MDIEFDWDDAKAESNYAKHGIDFGLAKEVFKDIFAIEFIDSREDYGEERSAIVGMAANYLLYVVYTERKGRIRIISARRAAKNEQNNYFLQNSKTDDSRRN
jgi:uncharacterized DUF497 family protein